MNEIDIAKELFETHENIILMYAFNATGKTRLSVAYKNFTKSENDERHTGLYYNAYSEDLFQWENDEVNNNESIRLNIIFSNLSQFHSFLDVKDLEEKLAIYNPKYKFEFNFDEDPEKGIVSISFFVDEETRSPIKISRGEERIFVWCFFLALFEVDAWASSQNSHFFIDDPVSSLDEHNIFITADSIFALIEENYLDKRIIVTTHHIGLFSILFDKLKKGEKSGRYNKLTKPFILTAKEGTLSLSNLTNEVFLFHLHLMQTLNAAIKIEVFAYHFVLLRQLLENIASFLGVGRISYVLEQIQVDDAKGISEIINSLSHKSIYRQQYNKMAESDENIFREILVKLQEKYRFIY